MSILNELISRIKASESNDIEFQEGSFFPAYSGNKNFAGVSLYEIDGKEYSVSVFKVAKTGVTLYQFDIDDVIYGGRLVVETAEEKAERETVKIKEELKETGEVYKIVVSSFEFGQQLYIPNDKPMPLDVGDDVIVVAGYYKTKFVGKVQKYFNDGGHYVTVVKPEDFRESHDEYLKEQKALEKAAKAQKAKETAEKRKAAGVLGGKALKGTASQKAWAEEIRAQAIKRASPEIAQRLLTDPKYQHSKFWIENRKAINSGNFLSVM